MAIVRFAKNVQREHASNILLNSYKNTNNSKQPTNHRIGGLLPSYCYYTVILAMYVTVCVCPIEMRF